MTSAPLLRTAVERTLPAVQDQLGQAGKKRLAALPPLIDEDDRIRLGEALAALFPGQDSTVTLVSFQQFRGRIATATVEAKVVFRLETNTQAAEVLEQRWCWFTGDDSAAEAAARFTDSETRNVVRVPQAAVQVGKRKVRYFVSYAHKTRFSQFPIQPGCNQEYASGLQQ
ncbi:MAG: hypothetical protein ACJ8AW_16630 [Rhodopila sp.]